MSCRPHEVLLVRHHYRAIGSEYGVVLDDNNGRIDGRDCTPDPIIHSIDVDTQHSDLTDEPELHEQIVNVFCSDEGLLRGQVEEGGNSISSDVVYVLRAAIKYKTSPLVLYQEETRI